ncbi:amino acid adenylation domain-containing protein [Pseudonocardia spirodelae]|uniref:Amino acid adenylation domain-containing protein n=1 Tax=Pseudonocardia spirodelae TaxID=3133431 RepID=A0ABU8T1T9_9PSEU
MTRTLPTPSDPRPGRVPHGTPATWPALFARQVAAAPDAVAVRCRDEQLTYAELDERAGRLASVLRARGAGPERLVALAVERGVDLVVAQVAILRAGAAYLPVDPDQPAARTALVLQDARPAVVLSGRAVAAQLPLPDGVPTVLLDDAADRAAVAAAPVAPVPDLDVHGVAYVIHTSGSTGRPKGVVLTHSGVAQLVATQTERLGVGASDRILGFASTGFDVAFWELCMALLSGGCLVVVPSELRLPVPELAGYAHEHAVTVMVLPPALLAALGPDVTLPPATLLAGTERVSPELVARWGRGRRMFNAYGPTEVTVNSTLGLCDPARTGPVVPIGIADPMTDAHVLGPDLAPVADGEQGELYLGGPGLARGYLNRPGLTAERFVADPFGPPGGRLYRTGDLVRVDDRGELEFLGRVDDQLKVRGYRIEPGEVESVLRAHPHVAEAVVGVHETAPGERRLAAWVVPATTTAPGDADERVADWREVHELLYAATSAEDGDPTGYEGGFAGWNSTYDGTPVPREDMRAWRDATVARIRELGPGRVLELGVGNGLLLSELAPGCPRYVGTDVSAEAVAALSRWVATRPELAGRVELASAAAHELDGLSGPFDTIVINSVAQYFPGPEYLTDVLRRAAALLAPGGAVFVGDVRHAGLLRTFRAGVTAARAAGAEPAALRRALDGAVAWEGELLCGPEFFTTLDGFAADVRIKRARAHDELSRYRYDVVLRPGAAPAADPGAVALSWEGAGRDAGALTDAVRGALGAGPDALRVTGVPDLRSADDRAVRARIDGDPAPEAGADPEPLLALGESLGYRAAGTWGPAGTVELLFTRPGVAAAAAYRPGAAADGPAVHRPAPFRDVDALLGALREHLRDRLPEWMIPAVVALPSIPVLANGKTDRAALPAPDLSAQVRGTRPSTPREELLCRLVSEVLGVPGIGVDDDFFTLGGDSVSSIRLVVLAREHGLLVTPRQVFTHRTVEELAPLATARAAAGPSGAASATALDDTARAALAHLDGVTLTGPVSPLQEGFFFHAALDPADTSYVVQEVLDLPADVDAAALRGALADQLAEHPQLRAGFAQRADGRVVQAVAAHVVLPWSEHAPTGPAQATALLDAERARPFDLARPPLLRAALLREPGRSRLALTFQHAVLDGWSVALLVDGLGAGYAARTAGAVPGPDGADGPDLRARRAEERLRAWFAHLDALDAGAAHAVWDAELAGAEPVRLLDALPAPAAPPAPGTPEHRPRPPHAQRTLTLDAAATTALERAARARGVTVSTVLHTAWALTAGALTGSRDVLVGSTVSGRDAAVDGIDGAVGLFVNTVPVRLRWAPGEPLSAALHRMQDGRTAVLDHPQVRLAELQRGRGELFDSIVVVENYAGARPGLVTAVEVRDAVHYPLALIVRTGRETGVTLKHDTARVGDDAAALLLEVFGRTLSALVDEPGRTAASLPLRAAPETGVHGPVRPLDTRTLAQRVAEGLARDPGATAVVAPDGTLTAAELDRRSAAVAGALRGRGAGPGTVVGVAVPRSTELMVALLGVVRAGAAYLPLDPEHPAERIADTAADAGVDTVLVGTGTGTGTGTGSGTGSGTGAGTELPELPGVTRLAVAALADGPVPAALPYPDPADAAYLIYTSGSTGRPKGVVVDHRAIGNRLDWMQSAHPLAADDRVLQKTPAGFDVSVWEFFWAPSVGAAVVLAAPGGHRDPGHLARLVRDERVTTLHFVPSMLEAFLADERVTADPSWAAGLRRVFCSGEALPASAVADWHALTGVALHNLYGPTEAAVDVTAHTVQPGAGPVVPIGVPVANTRTHVLDACLRPVPDGVPGELYLGGVQLARGYHARPGLTADRFVADPFGAPGERLYRTGDVVRRTGGELVYLGRSDGQVKIRGQRIELGEVEVALGALDGVGRAVVVVRRDGPSPALVGYAVPAPGGTAPGAAADGSVLDGAALRDALTATLPEALVPSAVVVLDDLPVTPNGKLDRAALPAPRTAPSGSARAAGTEAERVLCAAFAQVLGREQVGPDDDFLTLGGDSITSIAVSSRARRAGLEVGPGDVLAGRTPAAVAARAGAATAPVPPLPEPDPAVAARVREVAGDGVERVWPLSPLQEGLYFHAGLDGGADVYTVQETVELDHEIDVDRLRDAVATMLRLHPTLRAGFTADGLDGPVQFVLAAERTAVPVRLVHTASAAERDRLTAADRTAPFDLTAPPLFRITVLRGDGRDRLLVHRHLLIWDGWSAWLFLEGLFDTYAGSPPPAPGGGYEDLLALLAARDPGPGRAAWRDALAGLDEPTLVAPGPAGGPRTVAETHLDLDAATSARLRALARSVQVTPNTVLSTVWALALAAGTGRDDVVFGTSVAGRPAAVPDVENVVGLFLNTVPARVTPRPGETGAQLLARVQADRLALTEHETVGLGEIQQLSGHRTLFDTLFVYRPEGGAERVAELGARHGITALHGADATHYPLTLAVTPGERFRLTLSHTVGEAAAARWAGRVERILHALLDEPATPLARLDVRTADEHAEVAAHRAGRRVELGTDTVADLLAQRAAVAGGDLAVVAGDVRLTYAELDAAVNRTARLLLAHGAGPETVVALALPRSAESVVALFAVLRTGAAYLPLELDHPAERLCETLRDARPVVVLTTTAVAPSVAPAGVPTLRLDDPRVAAGRAALDPGPVPDDELGAFARGNPARLDLPAYVIYTSGSTGRPKGVVTPYRGLTNMQLNHRREIFDPVVADVRARRGPGARLRVAHTVSFAFDMSWEELLWLVEGHEVHVADSELRRDAQRLVAYCDAHDVDVVNVTPTYAAALLETGLLARRPMPLVLLGGEAVSDAVWAALRDADGVLGYNLYGPTEYTINTLGAGTTDSTVPAVGRPITNTVAHVLDGWLRPVPDGVPGELYIAGDGLARGYLDRFALTAERFVADPWTPGGRMYRTGDLVRRRPGTGGVLDFLGRTDDQVKIRGHRVEPGEVTARLDRHPLVSRSAVVPVPGPDGGALRLVGYVVPAAPDARARAATAAGAVDEWRSIYSEEYSRIPVAVTDEDYAGWDSSYTGEPIPFAEMSQWRAATLDTVRALHPRRVLEIGVGTGLLLGPLAPDCEQYRGTDLAEPVVLALRAALAGDPRYAGVELDARPADDLSGLPAGHYDTVLLNSVVQYFPDAGYLERVLLGAAALLAPGGRIVVGDVRRPDTLRAFHTAIARTRLGADAGPDAVGAAAERSLALEKELLLAPAFFDRVAARLGADVAVRLKRGDAHNELTRHRYDVELHLPGARVHRADPHREHAWTGWDDLVRLLAAGAGGALRVTGVPDVRLATERGGPADGPEPDALRALAARHGLHAEPTPAPEPGVLDVVLVPAADAGRPVVGLHRPAPAGAPEANDPAAARHAAELVPALREDLRASLPEHLVPAAFVLLDELPLTANGKLDTRALPVPDARAGAAPSREPQTAAERTLCAVFAEVLGLDGVGAEDDFFDLGGHSLLATRIVARLRTVLGAEVAIRDLFEAPTPARLAARLAAAPAGDGGTRPVLAPRPRPQPLPASSAQHRLWVLDRLDADAGRTSAYHFPITFRLAGALDADALSAALDDVAARHESLRTLLVDDGDGVPVQVVRPVEQARVPLRRSSVAAADTAALTAHEIRRPFDLGTELPVRGLLLTEHDTGEHVLVLVLHHVATDEWSDRPFLRDLSAAYAARVAGRAPRFTPLPVQYADHTLWQRELLGDPADPGSTAARQLAFWTRTLAGLPARLDLPVDRPEPPSPTMAGDAVEVPVEPGLAAALRRTARAGGASTFMLARAATAVLLHRLGAGTDIPVGAPVAGRGEQALEDLVGFFVNTLVLRTDLSGDPGFAEVLDRVRAGDLEAFAHADVPFEAVVRAVNPDRSADTTPLFQVMVVHRAGSGSARESGLVLPGVTVADAPQPPARAQFDLVVEFADRPGGGLGVRLLFRTELFDRRTVVALGERLRTVLRAVSADPHRPVRTIEVGGPGEAERVRRALDGGGVPPARTMWEMVAARIAERPGAVAVVDTGRTLTYAGLDRETASLARTLRAHGVGPETVVGVAVPRSADMVVAVLAVLRAGGAFLPLDLNLPADRLRYLLTDSGTRLVVTGGDAADRLPGVEGVTLLDPGPVTDGPAPADPPADPAGAAYVIYTSGSTGRPKGTVLTHAGIGELLDLATDRMRLTTDSRVLQFSAPGFDVLVFELCMALCGGARLVVAPERMRARGADPAELTAFAAEHRLTHLILPPSLITALPAEVSLPAGSTVLAGTEAVPPDLIDRWSDHLDLHVAYGLTEATVNSTLWHARPGTAFRAPIGRPDPGVRTYVLDDALVPVPPGVPGELYVAGAGLARGYLGRTPLTAERFVACPFGAPGERMYRTGDRVRLRLDPDAPSPEREPVLEFLGRADDQVKIRGYRIEPGEIEAVLAGHPGVAQAAVVVRRRGAVTRLDGYVVPAGGRTGLPDDLAAHLRERLPEHMVPAHLVALDGPLPRTPNGKIDRRALPEPEPVGGTGRAPAPGPEQVLAALVGELLAVQRVGAEDDFFALGGDSIIAIRLVSAARAAGLALTPRQVFRHRSVAALAAVATPVERAHAHDDGVGPVGTTPILDWLREVDPHAPGYNQSVLVRTPAGLTGPVLRRALSALGATHGMLRARRGTGGALEVPAEVPAPALRVVAAADAAGLRAQVAAEAHAARARLDPDTGSLLQAVWFDAGDGAPGRLLLVVAHVAVDWVSWRILLDDLAAAVAAQAGGRAPDPAPVPVSYRAWAGMLAEEALRPERVAEAGRWRAALDGPRVGPPLRTPFDPDRDRHGTNRVLSVELPAALSAAVVAAGPDRVLAAGLGIAVADLARRHGGSAEGTVALAVEAHGREEEAVRARPDLSRTVGWFTAIRPVVVDPRGSGGTVPAGLPDDAAAAAAVLARLVDDLDGEPDHGLGFGLLRHLNPDTAAGLAALPLPEIEVNYLGRFDRRAPRDWGFAEEDDAVDIAVEPDMRQRFPLSVIARTVDGPGGPRVHADLVHPAAVLDDAVVADLARTWERALRALTG